MFGSLGGPELVLILVIALIVFGPRKLPEIGKTMGKMLVEFRRASNDFKRTIEDEVEAEKTRETQASLPAPAPPAATIATPDTASGAVGDAALDPPPAAAAPAEAAPAGTVSREKTPEQAG